MAVRSLSDETSCSNSDMLEQCASNPTCLPDMLPNADLPFPPLLGFSGVQFQKLSLVLWHLTVQAEDSEHRFLLGKSAWAEHDRWVSSPRSGTHRNKQNINSRAPSLAQCSFPMSYFSEQTVVLLCLEHWEGFHTIQRPNLSPYNNFKEPNAQPSIPKPFHSSALFTLPISPDLTADP
jgi:hypothetical protein